MQGIGVVCMGCPTTQLVVGSLRRVKPHASARRFGFAVCYMVDCVRSCVCDHDQSGTCLSLCGVVCITAEEGT